MPSFLSSFCSIWSHLLGLVRDRGKTILITTHYIEEAKQANVVGLMRNGTLLAEDVPQVRTELQMDN
jgi:ABC-type multidrug transport system ATPase subunit